MALGPKGQREQLLFFIGILAGASVFLYWYFAYSPRASDLAQKEERVEALVTLNQKTQSEIAKGDAVELRRQVAAYRQNLTLLRTLIPAGNEVPALLEQVSTAARRVGLDLSTVDPQPVLEGENYDTYRYTISLVGSYHELAAFLTNVGSLTRIILPVNMTLQSPTNANVTKAHQKPNASVIEARFQLQTFVTHKPSPADELGPSKTGGAKT
jgi:type IV pilus assembly protein PilO